MTDNRVRKLFERHVKKLDEDSTLKHKTVRDFLTDQRFDILERIYFTGWQPIYRIDTSPRELFSQGMWTLEKSVCIGLPSFHKYLPGFKGYIKLKKILNDKVASREEVQAEMERENQRWEKMPKDKKKEQLQYDYDMGLDIDDEDIKKYGIKTIN